MSSDDKIRRQILPIPDQPYLGVRPLVANDPTAKFPPITQLRPPKGAPNVLIVLLDDVGFGASSTFGGPCNTPTLERLAKNGLRYTRFHTTALCSPTRAALESQRRAFQRRAGGSPRAHQGRQADLFFGNETPLGKLGDRHQEQVARSRRNRGRRTHDAPAAPHELPARSFRAASGQEFKACGPK